ncbi:MAG: bifunctional diaminohydroxyphosphoribosylaminopyrimidine deaminase/5-amino-6-(5-phosphoribosylamino)uracil reductase RibD [Gammaproteobacteria bacterium]|nr:bifunctional diaminohydroxyphosphoribosylaminopyrimidine deaminase/5-amino-6-(5-phosphoribosylamino)uracil reductase RibD [Gammaproteobacteria bacterium]
MFSAVDHQMMAEALSLARKGIATTQPNPRVGCVIVKNEEVIAHSWHKKAGCEHAEVLALQQAGEQAKGAVVYVTLEPCSHHGRTPPCADALIEGGVDEVIIAMEDPNPLVAGQGIKKLEQAGIKVRSGLLRQQAIELNRGFVRRMKCGRPWVTVKFGTSLDGRTAMHNGESQWITGPAARADVQRLRAASSAILTGAGTVLTDDPSLTVRLNGSARQPLRVVLDSNLSIPDRAKIYSDGHPLLLATVLDEKDDRFQQLRRHGIDIHSFPADESGRVNAKCLLQSLAADYLCNEILVEAGSVVCGKLLANELVDEIVLYFAPVLMGSGARGMFDIPELDTMVQRIHMAVKDVRPVGKDWRFTVQPVYQSEAE